MASDSSQERNVQLAAHQLKTAKCSQQETQREENRSLKSYKIRNKKCSSQKNRERGFDVGSAADTNVCKHSLPEPESSLKGRGMLVEESEGAFPMGTDPFCGVWEASLHWAILHILSHCRAQLLDPHKIIWHARTGEEETSWSPLEVPFHLKSAFLV